MTTDRTIRERFWQGNEAEQTHGLTKKMASTKVYILSARQANQCMWIDTSVARNKKTWFFFKKKEANCTLRVIDCQCPIWKKGSGRPLFSAQQISRQNRIRPICGVVCITQSRQHGATRTLFRASMLSRRLAEPCRQGQVGGGPPWVRTTRSPSPKSHTDLWTLGADREMGSSSVRG